MTKPYTQDTYLIKKRNLKNGYYSFTFSGYKKTSQCRPGHFIQVGIPSANIFFRRPMSIASVDTNNGYIEMIFKVIGVGTELLQKLKKGDSVNILGPLGVPFSKPKKNERIVIVAGGVGFPPLMFLANSLVENGFDPKKIDFFYGGRSSEDILEKNRIKKIGVNFYPITENGTFGEKGLVTKPLENLIQNNSSNIKIYSCGPEGMLKAVNELGLKYNVPGQLSLEAPMPCGVGICLGCVVPLTDGDYARVCCEGPVFDIGEVAL
jgi:dihydroorotate dehydrogenase electron transfer subunit